MQSHENLGPAAGWCRGVAVLSGLARQNAVLEYVAALRELGRGVEADLRHGATLDQLPRVIILGDVLAAHLALLVLKRDVLVELLLRVLTLAAPDGEGIGDLRGPGYQWHLVPWHA